MGSDPLLDAAKLEELHIKLLAATSDADYDQRVEIFAAEIAGEDVGRSESRQSRKAGLVNLIQSMRFVTRVEYDARMNECRDCEESSILARTGGEHNVLQCKICGCVMNAKSRMFDNACPMGRF